MKLAVYDSAEGKHLSLKSLYTHFTASIFNIYYFEIRFVQLRCGSRDINDEDAEGIWAAQ